MSAEGYVVRDHDGRELLRTPSKRTAAQMVDRLADAHQVHDAVAYRYRTDARGHGREEPAYWRPGDAPS